jgi:hypothetical protein
VSHYLTGWREPIAMLPLMEMISIVGFPAVGQNPARRSGPTLQGSATAGGQTVRRAGSAPVGAASHGRYLHVCGPVKSPGPASDVPASRVPPHGRRRRARAGRRAIAAVLPEPGVSKVNLLIPRHRVRSNAPGTCPDFLKQRPARPRGFIRAANRRPTSVYALFQWKTAFRCTIIASRWSRLFPFHSPLFSGPTRHNPSSAGLQER